ncbi:vitamin K epoxide reductase family protein [Georgenia alba]|uniref:Vitamin K epoxide reductase family protein n=1 Tax=Georgenia alba TaxID=2233858 RepID=A0ABW2QA74_9MICO
MNRSTPVDGRRDDPGRDDTGREGPAGEEPGAAPDARADGAPEEDLDDDELARIDQELARLDKARPTEHQLAGGAPRELGWLLTVGGLLGLWAAVELVLSEIKVAGDPNASLACDFNPLIGCGSFITTWQAHAFGLPNAVVGTVAFAAVMTVGVLLLAGARPARWFWVALTAGATGAIAWVFWFQYQAFFSIEMLCPYCLVVWVVSIPIFVNVVARAAQAGHLRLGEGLRRALVLDRWLIVAVWYLVVLLVAVVVFWDRWLLVLA